jgi:choline dehydrogenase-like flavoprotein
MKHVIVGAGSAGCVLAARLTEDPATRVCLIEAGPRDNDLRVRIPAAFQRLFQTKRDWSYRTTPQAGMNGRRIYFPRGRMLGGTSSINAQIWTRGHPLDFEEWVALGNPGWSYAEVKPFFERAEGFAAEAGSDLTGGFAGEARRDHRAEGSTGTSGEVNRTGRFTEGLRGDFGHSGPIHIAGPGHPNPLSVAFLEAVRQADLPLVGEGSTVESQGAGWFAVTRRGGRRWSAADAYLRPALLRANLDLVIEALVTRIIFDGRRATGVEYRAGDTVRVAQVEGDGEVFICAGAVNSPQLLMLSGIGPAEHLAGHGIRPVHELPGVGGHLMDHLTAGVITYVTKPVSLRSATRPTQIVRWMLTGRGLLASNVGEAVAFLRTRDGLEAPDLEMLFAPAMFVEEGLVAPPAHGMTIGVVALTPESAGHIRLSSADPAVAPAIDTRFLCDEGGEDMRLLIDGVRMARRVAASAAFDGFRGEEFIPGRQAQSDAAIAEQIRLRAQTLYHPACTCRMGTDDGAVVDGELRVHGVEGLRVVDASVMPKLVRAHPNAAVTMIAERAADRVRRG